MELSGKYGMNGRTYYIQMDLFLFYSSEPLVQ